MVQVTRTWFARHKVSRSADDPASLVPTFCAVYDCIVSTISLTLSKTVHILLFAGVALINIDDLVTWMHNKGACIRLNSACEARKKRVITIFHLK